MILIALNLSSFCDETFEKRSILNQRKNTVQKVPLYTSVEDRSREGDLGGEFVKP